MPKSPIADQQAHKAAADTQRREMEDKMAKAQRLRIDYTLGLLDLGLDETLTLDYQQDGVFPRIRMQMLNEEQVKKNRIDLEKIKTDLMKMTSGIITNDTDVKAA